jgi:hypothetical protein
MTFPLDHSGEISWSNIRALKVDDFRRRFLEQAVSELKVVKASEVEIKNDRVFFKAGMFRIVSNWNVLTFIDRGYIEASPSSEGLTFRYLISFRQPFVASLCLIGAMIFILLSGPVSVSLTGVAGLSVGGWLLLFGLNWLIAIVRFPAFVEKIIRETRI